MRGGKREGAGRKVGARGRRTKEIIAKAEELGCDPVEALLELTAWAMKQWRDNADVLIRIQCGEAAADWAAKAAPYVRPKLAQVEVNADVNNVIRDVTSEPISDEDWTRDHAVTH